jgi:periplasmic protein TonB
MPRDLFGDVVSRPPSVRSRRAPVVIASIVAHVAILLLLVVTTLVAADAMPMPREALAYFDATITLPPPPPPPPPRPVVRPPHTDPVNPNTVPLVAPYDIAPEKPREIVEISEPANTIDGIIGVPGGTGIHMFEPPPPPPPPAPPTIIHVGGTVRPPQKIVHVAPIYPPIAQMSHKEGIVIIEATIDVAGNVVAAKILRSEPLLDQAAVDAVRQWKFTPTLLNGVPVPVLMTVTVNFKFGQ